MHRAMSLRHVPLHRRHTAGGSGTCVHVPPALQTSSVQSFPSLAHAVPACASRQCAEQQSAPPSLEGSQLSRGSITPLPHFVAEKVLSKTLALEVHVPRISSPSPMPVQAKSAPSPAICPGAENAPKSAQS